MALTCMAQFVYQNVGYGLSRQDRSTPKRAHCHEIAWELNPNTIETLQVFVHLRSCTKELSTEQKAAADDRGYNVSAPRAF